MKYYIVTLAFTAILLTSCKEKETHENTTVTTMNQDAAANVVEGPECYLKVVGKDSMIFIMERNGDSIRGEYDWKPSEKDRKLQNFKGTLKNGVGKTVAVTRAEGMENNEELNFKVTEDGVIIEFGEMVEGKDGVWRYKSGSTTSGELLPKVDCR